MEVTRTFRPVLLGDPQQPAIVGYLAAADGETYFHDGNLEWPVAVPLDAAAAEDLPQAWRSRSERITILDARTVSGTGDREAFDSLLQELERLQREGAPEVQAAA